MQVHEENNASCSSSFQHHTVHGVSRDTQLSCMCAAFTKWPLKAKRMAVLQDGYADTQVLLLLSALLLEEVVGHSTSLMNW